MATVGLLRCMPAMVIARVGGVTGVISKRCQLKALEYETKPLYNKSYYQNTVQIYLVLQMVDMYKVLLCQKKFLLLVSKKSLQIFSLPRNWWDVCFDLVDSVTFYIHFLSPCLRSK